MRYPVTPDGHYFVVKRRLWRCTNPELPEEERQRWVRHLMSARRAVRAAADDAEALAAAREQVQQAKVALGERGPPWWGRAAPTYDRCLVENTPYAAWYAEQPNP